MKIKINLADLAVSDLSDNSSESIFDAIKILTAELADRGVSLGELSDGYHTYNELYYHRAILFSIVCADHADIAWKSKQHNDPSDKMYDGMFIAGIDTPDGQATYHNDVDPYWDMFDVKELERAPKWDGHTPAQAIERLRSVIRKER